VVGEVYFMWVKRVAYGFVAFGAFITDTESCVGLVVGGEVVDVMMARYSSGSIDAYQHQQYSDSMGRERGVGNGSRVDKLLGFSPLGHNSVLDDSDELSELNEADVWEIGASGSPDDRLGRNEVAGYDGTPNKSDSSDTYRYLNSGRRWLGLDKEPGLSMAFGDSGRQYGLSGLSPQRLVGLSNYPGQSTSRDGGGGRMSAAARMIPPIMHTREVNNSRPAMHQSAPVNVPDWSKILGAQKKSSKWTGDVDDDKEEVEEERLPPHLQLAREYAQSQMSTFSVCEGAGRTLKGRDLSRVRNAVLKQTGFLDS
jgi:hypothetical protein